MNQRSFGCVVVLACGCIAVVALGQATPPIASRPSFPVVGEVTGNNVYVRSGPSTNYYPVVKLGAGQRVTIVGRESDWYVVKPPAGTFSLIHKTYVDVATDSKDGVVNADAVRVRAGSTLSQDLYATQIKLNRGAIVTVIAQDDDYLRIVPPDGAKLYMHSLFVQPMLGAVPTENAATTAAGPNFPAGPSGGANDQSPREATAKMHPEVLAPLEAALEAEMNKPLRERDYQRLQAGFQEFAGKKDAGTYVVAYARARAKQLAGAIEMQSAVMRLARLGEDMTTIRKDAVVQRDKLRPTPPVIGGRFDATGKLVRSWVYAPSAFTAGPKRFRLIHSNESPSRTLCYVEIPADSTIDVDRFLGRKVGIRARERIVETGDVDPIPILVAAEIVLLDVTPESEENRTPTAGGAAGADGR